MQVSTARVSSSEASEATKIRRSRTLSMARSYMSGGDDSVQLQSELKCLTREERESVLAGANLPIVIPVDHSLAMKADLALPWAKLRIVQRYNQGVLEITHQHSHSRWLKAFNISLASERKQRVLAKDLVGENYKVESVPFSFTIDSREVIQEAPFVYVPNLIQKLADVDTSHQK